MQKYNENTNIQMKYKIQNTKIQYTKYNKYKIHMKYKIQRSKIQYAKYKSTKSI